MAIEGRATLEGTRRFAQASGCPSGHFRQAFGGVTVSSIGLGTYLGPEDDPTDRALEESAAIALSLGVNVFDTAVNYRGQRSERALGRVVARATAADPSARSRILVSTKGGFLPHDSQDPRDAEAWVRAELFERGLLSASDLAAGCHSLAPDFLDHLLDRSRENLDLATIDLYYLHNPETQLQSVPREEFRRRLRGAIELLERAAAEGRIGRWGLATWDGLRVPPRHPAHVSLEEVLGLALEVAGGRHHFAAIQAPVNLAMPQAVAFPSQVVAGRTLPLLAAASELSLAVFGSASILQGRLVQADLPAEVDDALGEGLTGAARALQFPRSAPGLTCALVGVSRPDHARDTFSLSRTPPVAAARILELFA
jgi:aryl-alcohol dehydrogenase-like predicted oxidoreductase